MNISFQPLNELHFLLLLKWLESSNVKKWWDQDIIYTVDLVKEKYASYTQGYKEINDIKKPINAYIFYFDNQPVGYIQIYNAYDFPRSKPLVGLPENLGAFDIFIGEEEYLGKNIGSRTISKFLNIYGNNYSHFFVDPDLNNIAAIKSYEKAGFKKFGERKDTHEIWMLLNMHDQILEQLKSREPIFHHPSKFGKTKEDILNQICEEFWEVGASGTVYSKQDVIDTLLERYNDPDYQDIWEAKDFKLIQIAPDNYLLTYVLIQNKIRITRRSTIWRKINDNWKILYHQGTIVSEKNHE
ncbi:MAG: GNAT family N-acetyltransferase [Alphaproteobacteria bacterium]